MHFYYYNLNVILKISNLFRTRYHLKKYVETNISFKLSFQGTAVGKCPKNKLYRGYIELELQLREFERCRILYEKFLEFGPENCTSWIKVGI